ncbi:MAG: alpha/beta fold hydrolase [Anaerolineae bacterium]|nr:alpha/beta fold hydrolase [Anaerolineae bacterium]
MRKRTIVTAVLMLMLCAGVLPTGAQEGVEPQRIEITGADGQLLVGFYYVPAAPSPAGAPDPGRRPPPSTPPSTLPASEGSPGVLLLHMIGGDSESWSSLTPALTQAGYATLAVDMRGFGETGGAQDWGLAEQDTYLWLDWLADQPEVDPNQLNIVGASVGANLALRAMAEDNRIVTTVALSPGAEYWGVTTEEAMAGIGDRPLYFIASQGDTYSAGSVWYLAAMTQGDTAVRVYPQDAHGTDILQGLVGVGMEIVDWMTYQNHSSSRP